MKNANARRRARRWARHMNRTEALGAHRVSWAVVRHMNHPGGVDAYFYVRRQSPLPLEPPLRREA